MILLLRSIALKLKIFTPLGKGERNEVKHTGTSAVSPPYFYFLILFNINYYTLQ